MYVNPYLVLKSGSYTKHFYIEGQRIVSKLGDGLGDATKTKKAGSDKVNYQTKYDSAIEGIVRNLKFLGQDGAILTAGKSGKVPPGQILGNGNNGGGGNGGGGKDNEAFQYYFHPDHLGSTSYITDASGEVYQHLEYFAFGETFVEEHSNTDRTPYLFNGKELDEETGLYYYGARYYDARTSVWLAVDPKASLSPSWSPYAFSFNNPILYVDPDGQYPWSVHIRSFINAKSVGGGTFRGDGRGPSTQNYPQAWSRVKSSFTIDPARGTANNLNTDSDPTVFYGIPNPTGPGLPPMIEKPNPKAELSNINASDNSISLDFKHSAKDPITPGLLTPDLDVQASLIFTEDLDNGILNVTGTFTGDAFPSTEAFITDQSGETSLLLGAHKEQGGLGNLFFENRRPTFTVNMQVHIDSKGNFTGVTQGDRTYTVQEWNKYVQTTFNNQ